MRGRLLDIKEYPPKFFEADGDCIAHNDYKCEECREDAHSISTAVTVVSDQSSSYADKAQASRNFEQNVKFVKVALDMKEEKINNTKVVDLPKLVEKAKSEITVGKMQNLIDSEGLTKISYVKNFLSKILHRS